MELLDENRSLIHAGKLWSALEGRPHPVEFFALLFDNYCGAFTCGRYSQVMLTKPLVVVLTKPWEENGVTKYQVFKRASYIKFDQIAIFSLVVQPIPIDFLALEQSQDPQVATSADRTQHFCLIYHVGGPKDDYSLFTKSAYTCSEWREKVEKAIGVRKVSLVLNEVFLVNALVPGLVESEGSLQGNGRDFVGKVTCSTPFSV